MPKKKATGDHDIGKLGSGNASKEAREDHDRRVMKAVAAEKRRAKARAIERRRKLKGKKIKRTRTVDERVKARRKARSAAKAKVGAGTL